ncbi:unnamed protein product [Rhizopus microsporus]
MTPRRQQKRASKTDSSSIKRRLHIGGQSNAAQRCLNDEHRFICSTSQCFERKPSSFPPAIYQLKHCKLCLAGNGQDIESLTKGCQCSYKYSFNPAFIY